MKAYKDYSKNAHEVMACPTCHTRTCIHNALLSERDLDERGHTVPRCNHCESILPPCEPDKVVAQPELTDRERNETMSEHIQQGIDRIEATCQSAELAEMLAWYIKENYEEFGVTVVYHDTVVEVSADYVTIQIEDFLKNCEHVQSMKRYDVMTLL